MDRGPWMQTFTGRAFYVIDPRPEDVEPEDIAHGLSFECRYNVQCHEFWSVAQHSICVAREARRLAAAHPTRVDRLFLLALLHDADEACRDLLPLIKRADLAVLRSERDTLLSPPPQPWDIDEALVEPALVAIEPRHPAVVFNAFLGVFLGALGKARDEANAYGNAQELRG